jgi:Anthrone oxygenase
MLLANFATLATALFTGAAVYISLVEHPARLLCPTAHAVEQWRPSYKRAIVMQVLLVIAGSLLAIAAWLIGAGLVWLLAGLVLGSVVPFTLIAIWPTNKRLEDPGLDTTSEFARSLLVRWGHLHAVRSGLSLLALILMLFARL